MTDKELKREVEKGEMIRQYAWAISMLSDMKQQNALTYENIKLINEKLNSLLNN